MDGRAQKILILGGGYGGLCAARTLQRESTAPLAITVVDPSPYMTYQPLLPEVAGGHVHPGDVTIPLRRALRRCRIVRGSVVGMDTSAKGVTVRRIDGSEAVLPYDQVVVAMGAVTRVFPTPGLEEFGIGFKTVEEAVFAHNHVLEQISLAANTPDDDERRRALTIFFVGAGYTGVEALSELQKLSLLALQDYPQLNRGELRWILIEALDRVAPEVGPELSAWTLKHLRGQGIDVRLKTTVKSCEGGDVVLSTGETISANTLIWTAGVQPNPILEATDLPRGPKGHVMADATLAVVRDDGSRVDGVWAIGDIAQIPDLTASEQPAYYPPNAQNAMRQGPVVARNILATLRREAVEEYRHPSLGTVASFGIATGAANIKGVKLRGLPAWLAHRGYHLLALPTFRKKVRVLLGWVAEALTGSETTPLRTLEHPRRAFHAAFVKHEDSTGT
ncbi:NAD(P)/FAD-dependent oxidoreductase [Herbiconiux sp. VKM Ac-2851]|uniref:NAD(P)/FAD-dependent oxidoreductase n=1 Tax=Herbiconiux sp. VKM Ac-2851 TaxID=2739025 RepID=UPI001566F8EB|nr:FAD-dependent oxidoreductase [Herbiconiux sp. VKM Ac-2851]NQX37058.1 FAD-dependent oxidoreductase [Herbiconiux sp. VKM Ac-2851]